jgi:hypothetical protein
MAKSVWTDCRSTHNGIFTNAKGRVNHNGKANRRLTDHVYGLQGGGSGDRDDRFYNLSLTRRRLKNLDRRAFVGCRLVLQAIWHWIKMHGCSRFGQGLREVNGRRCQIGTDSTGKQKTGSMFLHMTSSCQTHAAGSDSSGLGAM